jgi:hypothetical protein
MIFPSHLIHVSLYGCYTELMCACVCACMYVLQTIKMEIALYYFRSGVCKHRQEMEEIRHR